MMTNLNIVHRRLYNQHIAGTTFEKPSDVVGWLGAVQAQDYLGALWAIGLRMRRATEAGIEQAIADRTIIRTWPMRGTLHFVTPEDVHWMLELLTPRIIAQAAGRHRQLELDEAMFARSKNLFTEALQGDKQLTRDEMYQLLERANISTAGQRGYHLLWRAAQEGLICFGAPSGKQQTFTLLDEWAPRTKRLERDEALAELTRRYFTSHGPATLPDFVGWSGLTVTDARAGLEMVKSHLGQELVNGQTYWLAPDGPAIKDNSPATYLLPGFDEYMLGYKDRTAALDPIHTQKITPGNNGVFSPTIVISGRVAGTWKRKVKKNAVVMTLSPFTALTEAESQAIAVAAWQYGAFLELPVVLA